MSESSPEPQRTTHRRTPTADGIENNNTRYTMTSLVDIRSSADLSSHPKKAVLLFGADWHEACPMLENVLSTLALTTKEILFGKVDAELCEELSESYGITMVPTVIALDAQHTTVVRRLEGERLGDPSQLTLAVQELMGFSKEESKKSPQVDDPEELLNARLAQLIQKDVVMLFMKGSPANPRCGFSRQAVELLQEQKVPFGSFDILEDENVRQGLKKYSDWPTYPQIYVKGELMGGLDILKETLAEGGNLLEEWGIQEGVVESLDDRLKQLVRRSTVMLFMKGLPSNPRCGFSRQIVEILDATNVAYDAFDILSDEDVRQGLKTFSDWPTFPQLYVHGELIGGLDIVRELQESGDLEETLREEA